jgi:hypothetical protein
MEYRLREPKRPTALNSSVSPLRQSGRAAKSAVRKKKSPVSPNLSGRVFTEVRSGNSRIVQRLARRNAQDSEEYRSPITMQAGTLQLGRRFKQRPLRC